MNRNFNTVIWPQASFDHFLFELWKERQLSQFCAAGCRCDQPDTCPPTTVPPPPNQCGVRCSCSAAYYCPENGFSMVLCPIGSIQKLILCLNYSLCYINYVGTIFCIVWKDIQVMVRLHLVFPVPRQRENVTLVRRVITAFREKNRNHVHRGLFRGNQGHPLFPIVLLVYQVNFKTPSARLINLELTKIQRILLSVPGIERCNRWMSGGHILSGFLRPTTSLSSW